MKKSYTALSDLILRINPPLILNSFPKNTINADLFARKKKYEDPNFTKFSKPFFRSN